MDISNKEIDFKLDIAILNIDIISFYEIIKFYINFKLFFNNLKIAEKIKIFKN